MTMSVTRGQVSGLGGGQVVKVPCVLVCLGLGNVCGRHGNNGDERRGSNGLDIFWVMVVVRAAAERVCQLCLCIKCIRLWGETVAVKVVFGIFGFPVRVSS